MFITCTGICALSYFLDIKKKLTAIARLTNALTTHKTEEALTIPSSEIIDERSMNVPPATYMTAASFKKEIDITIN
jgi:hypothetical protein